jgi:hypothetical protein
MLEHGGSPDECVDALLIHVAFHGGYPPRRTVGASDRARPDQAERLDPRELRVSPR